MKAVFETRDYGRIEVTRVNLTGDASGYVYFRNDDYETFVNADGTFLSQWDTPFRVAWPSGFARGDDAVLEVTTPRTVGFSPVDRAVTGVAS